MTEYKGAVPLGVQGVAIGTNESGTLMLSVASRGEPDNGASVDLSLLLPYVHQNGGLVHIAIDSVQPGVSQYQFQHDAGVIEENAETPRPSVPTITEVITGEGDKLVWQVTSDRIPPPTQTITSIERRLQRKNAKKMLPNSPSKQISEDRKTLAKRVLVEFDDIRQHHPGDPVTRHQDLQDYALQIVLPLLDKKSKKPTEQISEQELFEKAQNGQMADLFDGDS